MVSMNFLGVVPILIQWLALLTGQGGGPGTTNAMNGGMVGQSSAWGFNEYGQQQPMGGSGSKTYWQLLNDLKSLPEDEIENFLPQLCNILVDNTFAKSMDYQVYGQLRSVLLSKCAGSLPFGMRVCALITAMAEPPSESIFKVFSAADDGGADARAERIRYLQRGAEAATFYGDQLPSRLSELRASYMKDMTTLLENFARIGRELKSYPVQHRNYHLRSAVTALNEILFNRMLSRGTSLKGHGIMPHDFDGGNRASGLVQPSGGYQGHLTAAGGGQRVPWGVGGYGGMPVTEGAEPGARKFQPTITAQQVASLCPEVAAYSLHIPLQHSREKVQRLLQFVVPECEILPSKERCPYLLVAEVLEQPFTCKSAELYAQRQALGVSALDAIQGRSRDLSSLYLQSQATNYADIEGRENKGVIDVAEHQEGDSDRSSTGGMSSSISSSSCYDQVEELASPLVEAQKVAERPEYASNSNIETFAREFSSADEEENKGGNGLLSGSPLPLSRKPTGSLPVDGMRGGHTEAQGYGNGPPPGYNPQQGQGRYAAPESPYTTQAVPYDPQDAAPQFPQAGGNEPPSHIGSHSGLLGYQNQNLGQEQGHFGDSDCHHSSSNRMGPALQPQQHQQGASREQYGGPPAGFLQKKFARSATWAEKEASVQARSPFGHLPGWALKSFIVKSGDDLRKEMLAQQVVEMMKQVFESADLDIHLTPYQIVTTGANAGLVEFINTARSIDRIKKSSPDVPTLREYFEYRYGPPYAPPFINAVTNFVKSLVGYSLLTYILQVRDRHNANLLLDDDGHIVHIDFGFILGDSPGMNMNFENAPFKMTREYVELLGGLDSDAMVMFQDLFLRGFFALQRHTEGLAAIVQLFCGSTTAKKGAAEGLRTRMHFARSQTDVLGLVRDSMDNWRTKQYDWFQQRTNGILM